MVRRRSLRNSVSDSMRRAFTMIELIFAIVVLAVVMLTIPMMIQANNKALEGNIAQEAIFLVSAVLSETTTLVWDDHSPVGTDSSGYSISKILDVSSGTSTAYDRPDINSSIRVGGLDEDLHRSFVDYNASDPLTLPSLGNGEQVVLTHDINNSVADAAGYKSQFTIVARRQYVSDAPEDGTAADPFIFYAPSSLQNQSNIKMTTVEINATVDGTNLVIARLRAYTCNIGEIDYAKRRFD